MQPALTPEEERIEERKALVEKSTATHSLTVLATLTVTGMVGLDKAILLCVVGGCVILIRKEFKNKPVWRNLSDCWGAFAVALASVGGMMAFGDLTLRMVFWGGITAYVVVFLIKAMHSSQPKLPR